MRKLTTLFLKALPLLFVMPAFTGLKAQTFQYTVDNVTQVSANIVQFDLELLNLDPATPIEIATIQAGVLINPATYGGGTIIAQIVPGSSTMGFTQIPTSVAFTQSQNAVKLASKAPPGCGGGTLMSTDPADPTILTRIKLTNTQPWNFGEDPLCLNPTFNFTTTPYPTRISWYDPVCENVALPVNATNCFTVGNLCGAVVCDPPLAFSVTGGGSYCQGGAGVAVGLSGSEADVTYTLYNGAVAEGSFPGTGAALDFGLQMAGNYTVIGERGCPAPPNLYTAMTGSAVVTETPSSTVDFFETACDSYTWTINGQTYTASGNYTVVIGCVTNILHLTITCYCIPPYSTGTDGGDYISLVQLGSINNATDGAPGPFYTYYSSLSTDLATSTEYTITLSAGTFGYGNNISVWIDYNRNDVFEPGEKLGNVDLIAAPVTGTITFTVPANALPGTTRMRVREAWATGNMMDPCSFYDYGETEDYNVNILPVEYCIPTYDTGADGGDYISLVQLGSINNATGASASPFYTYYNSLSTDLDAGSEYTVTVSAGTYFEDNDISVWIDYNYDGNFDASEKLGNVTLPGAPVTGTITFTVPVNALPGTTRMRVRDVWNVADMDACGHYSYGETEDYNIRISNSNTILDLTAFLEGLYAGSGTMNQASNESGQQFGAGIADKITVELHNAGNYGIIEYSDPNVFLSTGGSAQTFIPSGFNGSYYLTVKHRNSIETTSASPVSFAGNSIGYDFSAAASQAYGNNQLNIEGAYVIYSGDVNQDGVVDTADMTPIDNDSANYVSGYLATDVNGDGVIDTADMTIVDNNAAGYVGSVTP